MASKRSFSPLFVLTLVVSDDLLEEAYLKDRLIDYFANEVKRRTNRKVIFTEEEKTTIYEYFLATTPLLKKLEKRLYENASSIVFDFIEEQTDVDYLTGGQKAINALFKKLNINKHILDAVVAEQQSAESLKEAARKAAIAELRALGYTVNPPVSEPGKQAAAKKRAS